VSTISGKFDLRRRHLLGAVGMTAVAPLGMLASVNAQPAKTTLPPIGPDTNISVGPLKQINAGLLNVAYAEAGPIDGPAVILLHGWPYDIHSFVDATPLLASIGYRVLVPYLRGYGPTRFLASETFRNGQPAALAVDVTAFMDALGIERRSSPASIGALARPILSRRSGRSA
jgi:alpha/beta hydrolase fold